MYEEMLVYKEKELVHNNRMQAKSCEIIGSLQDAYNKKDCSQRGYRSHYRGKEKVVPILIPLDIP